MNYLKKPMELSYSICSALKPLFTSLSLSLSGSKNLWNGNETAFYFSFLDFPFFISHATLFILNRTKLVCVGVYIYHLKLKNVHTHVPSPKVSMFISLKCTSQKPSPKLTPLPKL